MGKKERKIKMKRTVQASRERVFAALTDAGRLQEWLCDWAWTDVRAGGRCILRWNSGYEVLGTFAKVAGPEDVVLIWQGSGEPAPTLVAWDLDEADDGTEVTVKHGGFGSGSEWAPAYTEAQKGWTEALENLQSVLEEGIDLREARQPFLGVQIDAMSPERAEKEGIATDTGVYVTGLVEDGAAEAAGVQTGDVIVGLGGREVAGFPSLTVALRAFRVGDTAGVDLIRGQKSLTVSVTLKQRPVPEVPSDRAEAAAKLREKQAEWNAALAEATAGLSEEEAGQPPAEGEWSVKQVLAHLISTERYAQERVSRIAVGYRLEGNPDYSMAPDQIALVLASEPTLATLLARFARDQEETTLLLEHLSEGTLADPYRLRQILHFAFGLGQHTEEHIGQIRRTLEAVRGQTGE